MSRYQFNPQLDPNRGRNRRLALMTLGIAAGLLVAIALIVTGLRSLVSISGAAPKPTAAVKLQVTIVAPVAQPLPSTAPVATDTPSVPADAALNPPATQAVTPMDPRGAVAGANSFACPSPRLAPATFGYGIQSQWAVGDIGFFNTMMAETLGLNWTKAQVRWKDFETAPGKDELFNWQLLDAFMADANKKGLNILLGIIDAPAWTRKINEPGLLGPPDDFKEAARFFQKVAARYKGCVQAIEVWNEMNLDREWRVPSGKIAAADYVRFLDAVTPGVREIDPSVLIVMGALSPTGASASEGGRDLYLDDYAYLDAFVAAGGPSRIDCVGVHLNGYNMPPDKRWNEGYNDPTAKFRGPFDNPNHSWSFKSTLFDYRAKTGKPLCVTEFGWASMENLKRKDGTPVSGAPAGFEFALDNTEQEQADWIVQGFKIMRESGFVRFGIVFNLDYIQKIGPEPDDPSANVAPYSVTRRNGEPRPAFEAIKALVKE